ncbi:hypothetical protein P746_01193 [Enterococcus faecalis CBRD01]|nr:hypothetical protein P746_01193 [Enterococcus faecalis CBRD01]
MSCGIGFIFLYTLDHSLVSALFVQYFFLLTSYN